MRITLPLQTDLNVKNFQVVLTRGNLVTRLLARKQELVGKVSKWTLTAGNLIRPPNFKESSRFQSVLGYKQITNQQTVE